MSSGHYPQFDVLSERDAWDPHTRQIVLSRLEEANPPKALTEAETTTLRTLLRCLLYERRDELLAFVIAEIDQTLTKPFGEAEREEGLPHGLDLMKQGLAALQQIADHRYGTPFHEIAEGDQATIVTDVQAGSAIEASNPPVSMDTSLQKAFFKQALKLAASAYYSHPHVWSEIGYAGPAYPRGYLRIERGLIDPWEPKSAGKSPNGNVK